MSPVDAPHDLAYSERVAQLGAALTRMSRDLVASRREIGELRREVSRLQAELDATRGEDRP